MGPGELIAPLRERAFRLMFLAQASSALGDRVAPIAVVFAVLDLTGSPSDLGLVLAARAVSLVVFTLAGGVWADRLPRHRLMMASDVGRLVSQGLLAGLLIAGVAEIWHLVVLQAAAGAATAFFRPAADGLTPSIVSPGHLQNANALLSLTFSSAQVAGPALAGAVIVTVGPAWAIAFDAATFGLSGLLLGRIAMPRRARAGTEGSFFAELRGGFDEVRSRDWLWVMIVAFALFQLFVLAPFFVLGPAVADRELGGAGTWALITGSFGAGAVLGALIGLRWHPGRPLLACNVVVLLVIPQLLLLAVAAPAPAIAVAAAGAGLSMSLSGLIWDTVVQENITDHVRSRVAAFDWMGSSTLAPLGYAFVGPLAVTIGIAATLQIAAALTALSVAAALATPGVRRLPRGARETVT